MNKVQGAKVAAGTTHLHTISDVALANNICDAYDRPVQYIVNGERVEYTLEDLAAELERRGGYASEATAQVMMLAPREMHAGDRVITKEHGMITLTETPSRMRGAVNKSVLAGTNDKGETVYVVRSAFLSIVCTR